MKAVIVVCILSLAAMAWARPEDKYDSRYDSVNVDEVLENDRILANYVDCLLDKGKCTPEGKELKEHVGDALQTECAKCTDTQKKEARRVIKHIINKEPAYWEALVEKYDSDKKYSHKYEKELREIKD